MWVVRPLMFKNSLPWRVFSDTDRALLGKHNSLQLTTAVLMTTPQLRTRGMALALAAAAAGLHGAAMSAPASSQELNGTADSSAAADTTGTRRSAPGVPATVTGVPQSRTVELLLQMQDKPDFAGGDASRSSATEAGRRATTSGTSNPGAKSAGNATGATDAEGNPLANLKATVLGSSAQNAGGDNTSNREPARPADMAGNPAAGPAGGGLAARDDGQPRASLLSNPVIRFIRENRALTIGVSLAVLIGLWTTATLSMRRSR